MTGGVVRMRGVLALGLIGIACGGAAAAPVGTREGVTFPSTVTVGDRSLVLNGTGVRVAYLFVKVYVAALYLPQPTGDAEQAIERDQPKRIVLHLLREVPHQDMVDAMREGFAHTASPALQPEVDRFAACFTRPLASGSTVIFDYVPGTGTTVQIAGQAEGVIPGADFMRALWGIWLGADPPGTALKAGLLGGA
jgi:Chalcone isomerase-like